MAKHGFDKYLSRRSKINEQLTKKLDEKNRSFGDDDETFWQPTADKSGNGWAIIRFLPPGGEEDEPFVKYYEYRFKGPTGQWYIEKARNSLGKDEPDPCHEFVQKFWNAQDETNARKYPRKQTYISNILVVKDPENPENDGKVFRFKYGSQIAQKIEEALKPKIPSDPAIDAFDMIEGSNFKLIIGKKDKYRTYENSKFDHPSPVNEDTKVMGDIYDKCYTLQEFVAPDKFKSYEKLKERLEKVLGKETIARANRAKAPAEDDMSKISDEDDLHLDTNGSDDLDEIMKGLDTDADDDKPF